MWGVWMAWWHHGHASVPGVVEANMRRGSTLHAFIHSMQACITVALQYHAMLLLPRLDTGKPYHHQV